MTNFLAEFFASFRHVPPVLSPADAEKNLRPSGQGVHAAGQEKPDALSPQGREWQAEKGRDGRG